jgi:hypothetical protein
MSTEQRYRPQDDCPLFSETLEAHIVAVTRGELPNRGTFCGNCYTPLSRDSARCPHCGESTSLRPPVEQVPDEVIALLREQRKTESRIVNAFAYAGLIFAIAAGLAIVLGVPYLREHLLAATIVFTLILLIGGRVAAGVIGGYYGDRIGFERARARLRERWAEWIRERDVQRSA